MARPVRRDYSAFSATRKRIPADVLAKAKGRAFVIDPPAVGFKPAVTAELAAEVKMSFRTADPAEAEVRMASATAARGAVVDGIRDGPVSLTHKQLVSPLGRRLPALRGPMGSGAGQPRPLDGVQGLLTRDPGRPARRHSHHDAGRCKAIDEAVKAFGRDLTAGVDALPRAASDAEVDAAMEFRFGLLTDWTLIRRGLVVDRETRAKLIREADKASTDAA